MEGEERGGKKKRMEEREVRRHFRLVSLTDSTHPRQSVPPSDPRNTRQVTGRDLGFTPTGPSRHLVSKRFAYPETHLKFYIEKTRIPPVEYQN